MTVAVASETGKGGRRIARFVGEEDASGVESVGFGFETSGCKVGVHDSLYGSQTQIFQL